MFNGFDLSTISDAKIGNTQINQIYYGSQLIWPAGPIPPHDYSRDYLTFEFLENGYFRFTTYYDSSPAPSTLMNRTIYYKINNGSWTQIDSNTHTWVQINQGDIVQFKGNNNSYALNNYHYTTFESVSDYNVYGNVMSLIYDDNFIGQTSFPDPTIQYIFGHLFYELRNVNYAINGVLYPVKHKQNIENMILPATVLVSSCYYYMFTGCEDIILPPELPATTLASNCYDNMFADCTALTTAPELPATTLPDVCYQNMFYGCSSLNYIKCLATDISANNCLYEWTDGVSSTGTFVKDANTTWPTGSSGIPTNWTVVNN